MNERNETASPCEPSPLVVETRSLNKVYGSGPQAAVALDHVDLKIPRGEFVAVMGASGSGKSTLLYLIAGLIVPTAGEVLIDGVALSTLPDAPRTRLRNTKMGFVFQRYNLLGFLSVKSNVELPLLLGGRSAGRNHRAEELLSAVGLQKKLPRRVTELSSGEQQRVAIARALANRPDMLLADEPTGNLDSRNAAAILKLLVELKQKFKLTILLVTHDSAVAMMADRVLIIADGKIEREAAPRELASQSGWTAEAPAQFTGGPTGYRGR